MSLHNNRRTPVPPIRVLLVDDHPVVLQALQEWLGTVTCVTLVGACNSAAEALANLAELSPDLVLLDANMPQISGLEAVPMIKQRRPDIRVVITSLDDARVAAARRMPSVDGVVHKEQLMEKFPPLARQLCHESPSV